LFSTISLKGVKYTPMILLDYHKSIHTFCFIALTKSVTQIIEVLLMDTTYRKESFPSKNQTLSLSQHKSDTKNFAVSV